MNRLGPFAIVFGYFFLFGLLSFPLNYLLPNKFFADITAVTGYSASYEVDAFIASLISFGLLGFIYFITPVRRYALRFQTRPLKRTSSVLPWLASIAGGLAIVAIMFYRSGWTVPLLSVSSLDAYGYRVYRRAVADAVGGSEMSLALYVLNPSSILLAMFSTSKWRPIMLASSILVLALTATLTLSRSAIAVPFVVLAAALLASKPLRARTLLLLLSIVLAAVVGMFSYSESRGRERADDVRMAFFNRVVHGQWLGLPLYLWRYEREAAPVISLMHPQIKAIFGRSHIPTPGRDIMLAVYPEAAFDGAAGNIPTLYIGEAYALMGWGGVIVSTVHVGIYMLLSAWSFSWIRKTAFTCILYGIVIVKIATGVTNGYSAFLGAGTTLIVALLVIYAIICQELQRRAAMRGRPDCVMDPNGHGKYNEVLRDE